MKDGLSITVISHAVSPDLRLCIFGLKGAIQIRYYYYYYYSEFNIHSGHSAQCFTLATTQNVKYEWVTETCLCQWLIRYNWKVKSSLTEVKSSLKEAKHTLTDIFHQRHCQMIRHCIWSDNEPTTHGLVFMLWQLTVSWMQTVAYVFWSVIKTRTILELHTKVTEAS